MGYGISIFLLAISIILNSITIMRLGKRINRLENDRYTN